jgi:lipooligosaccharide transport system permease protein
LRATEVATGEVVWALLRGTIYATGFLVTMVALGLVESAWAVLAVPGAVLIGLAFAGAGLAATTWMRSFIDFDYVNLAIVPLFLFSATFFPIARYPAALGWIVRGTPLYQGVALERGLVFGDIGWTLPLHAAYLATMGWIGIRVAGARLGRLLQP